MDGKAWPGSIPARSQERKPVRNELRARDLVEMEKDENPAKPWIRAGRENIDTEVNAMQAQKHQNADFKTTLIITSAENIRGIASWETLKLTVSINGV